MSDLLVAAVALTGLVAATWLTAARAGRARAARDASGLTADLLLTAADLVSADGQEALDAAVTRLVRAVGGDAGALAVVEGESLRLRGMYNLWPGARQRPISRGEAVVGRVWAAGRPRVLADLSSDPTHIPDASGVRSGVYVPGTHAGRVVVVLAVESRRLAAFDTDHIALLQPLADMLAGLVEGRRALHRADRLERQLLAAVDAQLRPPLDRLGASLATLEPGEQRTTDAADVAGAAATGRTATRRIDRLLSALVLAGPPQDVTFEPTAVDLAALVTDTLASADRSGPDVVVDASVGGVPPVTGDPAFLRTVLSEVVDNAVRYAGGVDVRIGAAVEGGEVVLTVRDRGPGVDAAEVDPDSRRRVFERPDAGPVGLGLHLAARLTEAMGGRLAVRSRPGLGTVVAITLPAARS